VLYAPLCFRTKEPLAHAELEVVVRWQGSMDPLVNLQVKEIAESRAAYSQHYPEQLPVVSIGWNVLAH
jgi:hypothetical protein